jgi:hypothetical protein
MESTGRVEMYQQALLGEHNYLGVAYVNTFHSLSRIPCTSILFSQ